LKSTFRGELDVPRGGEGLENIATIIRKSRTNLSPLGSCVPGCLPKIDLLLLVRRRMRCSSLRHESQILVQ
jgi:hypothetical protein